MKNSGKVLLSVEGNVKHFVKDNLAKEDNHLPDTEVGVWVHYLTEGIKRDFGRTWEGLPVSIRPKQSRDEKKAEKGKFVISKQRKNEIMAQLNWTYWEPKVSSGSMTMEEAISKFQEVAEEKKRLEGLGISLSTKKTEGIGFFDCERAVVESYNGEWKALEIYGKSKIKLLVPNIIENIFAAKRAPSAKISNMLVESAFRIPVLTKLKSLDKKQKALWDKKKQEWRKGVLMTEGEESYGGAAPRVIENMEDFKREYSFVFDTIAKECGNYTIKGLHIGKSPLDNGICFYVDIMDENNFRYIYEGSPNGVSKIVDSEWWNHPMNSPDGQYGAPAKLNDKQFKMVVNKSPDIEF